jgi:hypothetical protein
VFTDNDFFRTLGYEGIPIDVHLPHVVDDDGGVQFSLATENVVERRRLAGAEASAENCYRDRVVERYTIIMNLLH